MKLILAKNVVLVDGNISLEFMFNDKDVQSYILRIYVEKGVKINDVISNIKDLVSDYFINSIKYEKAVYIPSECLVSTQSEGYVDAHYNIKYINKVTDKEYITDDKEIGKNLISVQLNESTESMDVIDIEFKSLFLIDENYNMTTLWNFNNGVISEFIRKEIYKLCKN